jgi:rod shape-determining protein MreC
MGLTFGGRDKVTRFENVIGNIFMPIQKTFDAAAGIAESVFRPIFKIWENEKIVAQLQEENQFLKEELVVATLQSNEYSELLMLRKVFNYIDDDYRDHLIAARVVAKDPGNWYNMFTIDKGVSDGVTKNSVVINGEGLIGLAYEASDDWSKVIAIIDNKNSIGIEILDPMRNYEGLISGSVDGKLSGVFFDTQAIVEIGDVIVTSGKGLYPEGLIVGTVESIIVDPDALLIAFEIKPEVDFNKLNRVMVLPRTAVE